MARDLARRCAAEPVGNDEQHAGVAGARLERLRVRVVVVELERRALPQVRDEIGVLVVLARPSDVGAREHAHDRSRPGEHLGRVGRRDHAHTTARRRDMAPLRSPTTKVAPTLDADRERAASPRSRERVRVHRWEPSVIRREDRLALREGQSSGTLRDSPRLPASGSGR